MILYQRVKFVGSDGNIGGQPSNGTTLFAYGKKGVDALMNAHSNQLGLILKKG